MQKITTNNTNAFAGNNAFKKNCEKVKTKGKNETAAVGKSMLLNGGKIYLIFFIFLCFTEKTLAEQQQKAAAEKEANNLVIKPIEEVMEEDITSSSHKYTNNDLMEVDVDSSVAPPPVRHSFAARLGHAGLSPLVIGKLKNRVP